MTHIFTPAILATADAIHSPVSQNDGQQYWLRREKEERDNATGTSDLSSIIKKKPFASNSTLLSDHCFGSNTSSETQPNFSHLGELNVMKGSSVFPGHPTLTAAVPKMVWCWCFTAGLESTILLSLSPLTKIVSRGPRGPRGSRICL